jgi:hypothetical protein
MINDLGPDEMQNKAIHLQNIDEDTLNKILGWTEYHSHHLPPDDNTIHQRAHEIENSSNNFCQPQHPPSAKESVKFGTDWCQLVSIAYFQLIWSI